MLIMVARLNRRARKAQPPRPQNAAQIAFDQSYPGALHGHISAGAHSDANIGLSKRGCIVACQPTLSWPLR